MSTEYQDLQIFLAVIAVALFIVPVFERIRVTQVVGYLVAGVLLGPSALGVIADPTGAMQFSEFGVVFLMFSIGLELSPRRLYVMRNEVFGLGTAQLAVTMGLTFWLFKGFVGLQTAESLVLAGALSLSSTAVVLKLLRDDRAQTSRRGRVAFSILLLQDLAVVPLVVLLPMLSDHSAQPGLALVQALAKAVLIFLVVGGLSRWVVGPAMNFLSASPTPELFTFAVLLLVLGMGWLTQLAGLSFSLGALLAGLLMSGTQLRRRVEATIAPIQAVMLALFFITVGAMINLNVLLESLSDFVLFLIIMMGLKSFILFALCLLFGQSIQNSLWTGIALSQTGEFAFVLLKLGQGAKIVQDDTLTFMIVGIALSMAATPVVMSGIGWINSRMEARRKVWKPPAGDLKP